MRPLSPSFRPTPVACAVALLASLAAPASHGAESPPGAEAAEADNKASKMDVVVVTADRRAESIRRVPSSVTAINGAKLEDLGAARIDDFIGLMPGMGMVGGRPGNRLVTLRGVSSGGDQQNASVGTYIDDIPVGSSTTFGQGSRVKPDVDTFDLERLEVLRGPQGTLYGANSLGGLLKYVMVQPDPAQLSGFARVEGMRVAHGGTGYGGNAGINAPLGGHDAALRLSVFSRREAGYVDNVAPGGKRATNELNTSGGRLAFAIVPVKGFNVRASVLSQTFRTDGEPTEDVALATGRPSLGEYQQARYTSEASKQQFNLYSLSMDLDVAGGKLLSVTSYNDISYDRGSDYTNFYHVSRNLFKEVPLVLNQTAFGTTKKTQELRYTSPKSDSVEWIAGLFYTREDSDLNADIGGFTDRATPAPAPNKTILLEDTLSSYTQQAAYANARVYFSPKADIGVGVRYTHDSTSASDVTNGVRLDARQSSNFTSYMLAPRYLISKATMVYARAASASRPGGPNFLTAAGVSGGAAQVFEPDTLTSYEAGLKTGSDDGRYSFDLSAFYIDWKKVQLRTSTNGFFYIGNGGKAKSQGVEAAISARPVAQLSLSANIAYTDATLSEDALVAGGHKGDRLPNSARVSGAASVSYEMSGPAASIAYVGASLRHVGERLSNFTPTPRLSLPAFTTIDLRAGLRSTDWDLNVYVKNATDERAVETITTNFYPGAAAIARPRTIGLFATYRF